jgi:hypothetical protein
MELRRLHATNNKQSRQTSWNAQKKCGHCRAFPPSTNPNTVFSSFSMHDQSSLTSEECIVECLDYQGKWSDSHIRSAAKLTHSTSHTSLLALSMHSTAYIAQNPCFNACWPTQFNLRKASDGAFPYGRLWTSGN